LEFIVEERDFGVIFKVGLVGWMETYVYGKRGESVPRPGESVKGYPDYVVVSRQMPLVEDWERYGGEPPRVVARKKLVGETF
jgi:hypothetical protein